MEGRRSDFKLCLPFRQRRKGRLNKNGKGKRMGIVPCSRIGMGKSVCATKPLVFNVTLNRILLVMHEL